MPTTTAPEPEVDPTSDRPSVVLRGLAVVAALAMVLFWIWIFTGGPKKANPDRLDDRAYVARTEQRCQRLLSDLKTLPPADSAASAVQRADVLDQANALVKSMVDDIGTGAPRTGDDARRLKGWLLDWRTYIGDRNDYARRLRTNPDAQLLVSENSALRDPVDKTIEVFADVNDMPDCATPGDVG